MKNMTQKRCSIAPRALIKTRKFSTVMGFPGIIHRWGLASWNINVAWPIFRLIDVFVSLLSLTLPVELIFVLFLFLFHLSPHVPIHMSALLEILTLCCFN